MGTAILHGTNWTNAVSCTSTNAGIFICFECIGAGSVVFAESAGILSGHLGMVRNLLGFVLILFEGFISFLF